METQSNISVIMPVYNGEKFLKDSLNSLAKQTLQPQEIIIGDNASIDNTLQIAKQFAKDRPNIKIIHHESNIGFTKNLVALTNIARGDFICILCHDDLIDERYFELMYQVVVEEQVDLVFPDYYEIDENGEISNVGNWWRDFAIKDERTLLESEKIVSEIIQKYAFPCTITSLIRRDLLLKIGGFNPQYAFACDGDFYLRYLLAGCKVCYLRKKLFIYRRHSTMLTNEGTRTERMQDEVVYIFSEHLNELCRFTNENKLRFAIRFYKAAIKRILKASITGQYPTLDYFKSLVKSMKRFIFKAIAFT
ncbi:glycosyltransferase [Phormidium sp. LEGE 05292]|uniref:glycosyltransferase family 2 protein n=1 Tax=[Phormidium] sp. LEGE 05292 TaxID=767427 RepID=UPI00187EAF95|nr:glycosyltransferase [Phormidium sp. LEGE 05292]MBE9224281.1 glycosyltransferase [Phormidium sp. LEGE 05292]